MLWNFQFIKQIYNSADTVVPITDSVLLVKARLIGAQMWNPIALLIAHVKDLLDGKYAV